MVSVVVGGVAHQLGPPDGFLNGSFLPISVAGAVDHSVNAAEQEHNVLTNAEGPARNPVVVVFVGLRLDC